MLKIEGRARGAEYVKRVVECYDEALRAIEAGTYTPELAAGLKKSGSLRFSTADSGKATTQDGPSPNTANITDRQPRGARSTWAR